MGDQYARLGQRWRRPARGFRLSPTRLSVRRLRARLWTLLGLLGRYVRNVRLLTKGLVASSSSSPTATSGGGRRVLVGGQDGVAGRAAGKGGQAAQSAGNSNSSSKARRPACMRSNSFYARAVAECLEFIKGSNAAPASPSAPRHDQQQMLRAT